MCWSDHSNDSYQNHKQMSGLILNKQTKKAGLGKKVHKPDWAGELSNWTPVLSEEMGTISSGYYEKSLEVYHKHFS